MGILQARTDAIGCIGLTLWMLDSCMHVFGEIDFFTEWKISIPAYNNIMWDLIWGIYTIRYVLPWFY